MFDTAVEPKLLVRRINITANHTQPERRSAPPGDWEQMDLFALPSGAVQRMEEGRKRERQRQKTVLSIKEKYGKNAILTGTNFREGATARERNRQIGGHRA